MGEKATKYDGIFDYHIAHNLMKSMVAHSQRPGESSKGFVDNVGPLLESCGLSAESYVDPELSDRELLVAEIGDPQGNQILAAVSHADVVGVEGQKWTTSPWELREDEGVWYGRGVCDTHGSGLSMVMAATDRELDTILRKRNQRISIFFTYDEEATSQDLSMRGARLAAGLLGEPALVTAPYYIAGEPTEINGQITPMRSHKGRWLAHFTVQVEHSGHVSDNVQNALVRGAGVVTRIGEYASVLRYGSSVDDEAAIYNPAHSTVQVSAADVKKGDYSATPSNARFTVDMRTLPDVHSLRVREIKDLITNYPLEVGENITLDVVKDALGSSTIDSSLVVKIAEEVTGQASRGFNGGDEGRVMRNGAGKEGVTLGPGELRYAHMPNEQIAIKSIARATEIYRNLFTKIAISDKV